MGALEFSTDQEREAFLDEACGEDTSLGERVRELLAAHERTGDFLKEPVLDQLRRQTEEQPTISQDDCASPGDDSLNQIDHSFLQTSETPGSLGRLRHYEVLKVLGHGGFGVVLKAFDQKLHRMVAIKVMMSDLAATSPARKRFLREARATAAIRHENVVAIYAVEETPLPFLVMELIDGCTLHEKILQQGPLEVGEVIMIGKQLAAGLDAAHNQGLIHRDVKPANILLERGTGRAKLTDFGLARAKDDASLTQSGVISGTPLYMSPEQAQGQTVDERSDLYSLASVLYFMCSGRPPFRAATTVAVLRRVVDEEPRPIQEIVPEVPDWLCDLISQIHVKNPDDRIQTASEVAALLGADNPRSLAGQRGTRIKARWQRRSTYLWSSAFVVIAGIFAVYAVQQSRLFDANSESVGPQPNVSRSKTSDSSSNTARVPSDSLPSTSSAPAATESSPLATAPAEARHADAPASAVVVFRGHQNPVRRVAFTTDERFVVSASNGDHHVVRGGVRYHVVGTDNSLRLWSVVTGQELRQFQTNKDAGYGPQSFSLSSDGKSLVCAAGWGTANGPSQPSVYVWNLASGQLEHHLPLEGNHAIREVAFAQDGNVFRTASSGNGGIRQWAWKDCEFEHATLLDEIPFRVEAPRMSFSRDGNDLLSAVWDGNGKIIIWNADRGTVKQHLSGHVVAPTHVIMAHHGQRVLSCARDHSIRMWDVSTGKALDTIGDDELLKGEPRCLCFSSDSARFPVGYESGDVTLHDSATGEQASIYHDHTGPIEDVAFSPSGRLAASASHDQTVVVREMPERFRLKDGSVSIRDPEERAAKYLHSVRGKIQVNGVDKWIESPVAIPKEINSLDRFVLWNVQVRD